MPRAEYGYPLRWGELKDACVPDSTPGFIPVRGCQCQSSPSSGDHVQNCCFSYIVRLGGGGGRKTNPCRSRLVLQELLRFGSPTGGLPAVRSPCAPLISRPLGSGSPGSMPDSAWERASRCRVHLHRARSLATSRSALGSGAVADQAPPPHVRCRVPGRWRL